MQSCLFLVLVLAVTKSIGFNHHQQNHLQQQHQQQQQRRNSGPQIYTIGGNGIQSLPLPGNVHSGHSWPWGSHFVDFNERHPGRDQIAVESRQRANQYPQQHHQQQQQQQHGRTRSPVDSRQHYIPASPFISANVFTNNVTHRPLWDLFAPASLKQWWKGENVCIKREEAEGDDSTVGGSQNANSNVNSQFHPILGNPGFSSLTTSFAPQNTSSSSGSGTRPGLHMRLSTCEDGDTTHVCTTRILGPSLNNKVTTTYECCNGYTLDSRKQECVRGRYENILSTMETLGAHEFVKLVKSSGLSQKVETERLTIFVPIDEAMRAATSNKINIIPHAGNNELIRRRRNVYHYQGIGASVIVDDEEDQQQQQRQQQQLQSPPEDHSLPFNHNRGDSMPTMEMDFSDVQWRQNTLEQQDEYRRTHHNTQYEAEESFARVPQPELQNTLLSHMLQNEIRTDEFVDERVVYSENRDSVIRMNTWTVVGEKLNTVNCARMTSINHRCSNGVIHLIDRQLSPVTKTTAEILAHDSEFSLLYSLLRTSELLSQFQDANQHLTLLAFTNEAARSIDPSLLTRMQRGDPCLKRILQHHILPITFCSSVIVKSGQVRNVNHVVLAVERNSQDTIFINGSTVITRDIVTKNGVIHVIDKILFSENDEPLESALRREGLTLFLQSLNDARLSLSDLTNVTIFAPSNAAFETSLPQEIRSDPRKLREILEYHIAVQEIRAHRFTNQQELSTKLSGRTININLYSNFPLGVEAEVTAQCGRVTKVDRQACNGIIHVVDRVLIPAVMDVAQLLRTQPDFTILNRLIAETNLIDVLRQPGVLTLFAIPDAAFYALPKEELEKILNDRQVATQLLKSHIIQESLCCTGVLPSMWFLTKRVKNLNGQDVPVTRDSSGNVAFGNAKISACDLTASNGIIHTVTEIFVETKVYISNANFLMGSCLPQTIETTDIMALFFRG